MIDTREFQEQRPYLFSVAYRMLGSATEAEDVLQDAWLRAAASPEQPHSARAWLTTVITRLCLDRLKSARMTREQYVGPWLPEPIPTNSATPEPEANLMRQESITLAFLVLLETLTPAERAAYILREAFDYEYRDVAEILDASEASARQLVHRAKERLLDRKPRFPASPERQRELVSRFLDAAQHGDMDSLQNMLAADVVFAADGGGKVAAAGHAIEGASAVAKVIAGVFRLAARESRDAPERWRTELRELNGETALLAFRHGRVDTAFVFSVSGDQISAVNVVRNPEKLVWLERSLTDATGRSIQ